MERGLIPDPARSLLREADVQRFCLPAPDAHVGGIRPVAVAVNLDSVGTIGELHAQTAAAFRHVPTLAINQNLGVGRLHPDRERSEIVPLVAGAGRGSVRRATAV